MTIVSRFLRLWKADVHGVMDQLEDKGLLLKQHLREMEESLDRKARQLAGLTERLERLSAQVARQTEEMQQMEPDLELALSKEKDDIARMLIRRRRRLETTLCHLKEQQEIVSKDKTRLTETLSRQQLQFESLKTKADRYCPPAGEACFAPSSQVFSGDCYPIETSDEAVELELLQRKAALQKGGRP